MRAVFFGLIAILPAALSVDALEYSGNQEFRGNSSALGAASKTADGSAGVDGASGAATVRIPIAVPPGPGGLAPTLSLNYSSDQGDGPFGLGWSLRLGEIRCTARFGVPDYANCPEFELGGQLLVGPDGQGRYHTKVESFQRIRLLVPAGPSSAYWEVTAPGGTRRLYGETGNSKIGSDGQDTPATAPTARWLLSKIIDLHDNEIAITYDRSDVGVAYPATISYVKRPSSSAEREVTFLYESRPDEILDFPGGIPRNLTQRLHEIKVTSLDTIFSRRLITYSTSGDYSTHRSRIASTRLFGKDCDDPNPVANCPSLPAQTYEYAETNVGGGNPYWEMAPSGDWDAGLFVITGMQTESTDMGRRLADVNGDGLPDLVVGYCTDAMAPCEALNEGPTVHINNGSGWEENTAWTNAIRSLTYEAPTITVESANEEVCNATTGTVTRRISFATEEPDWEPIAVVGNPPHSGFETFTPWPSWHLIDINGDGFADLVTSNRGGVVGRDEDCAGNPIPPGDYWVDLLGGELAQVIFLNNGTGWDPAPAGMAESLPPFTAQTIVKHMFDSDSEFGGTFQNLCDELGWLGGWWPNYDGTYCTTWMDFRPQFVELNGDGLLDIIILEPYYMEPYDKGILWLDHYNHSGPWYIGDPGNSVAWIQNADGSGWTRAPNFDLPFPHIQYNWIQHRGYDALQGNGGMQPYDSGVYFVDLNRDGLTDVVHDDAEAGWGLPSGGPAAVLLGTGTGWCNDLGTSVPSNCVGDTDTSHSRYVPPIPFNQYAMNFVSDEAFSVSEQLVFVDVNGDGWVDLLQGKDVNNNPDVLNAWLHDPSASAVDAAGKPSVWVDASATFKPPTAFYPGTQFADLDGNGTADILHAWWHRHGDGGFFAQDAYLSPGTYSDLLVSVDNGRGGITDFTYVSAVVQQYDTMEADAEVHAATLGDADGSSEAVTQFTTKPVISERTLSGVGIAADVTTRYRYARPRFDPVERSGLGFGLVKTTNPDNSSVDAYYYQREGLVGRPSLQDTFDQTGSQVHSSSQTWVLAPNPGSIPGAMDGVDVARLDEQESYNVYGQGDGPKKQDVYSYDDTYGYNFVSQVISTRATGTLTTTLAPDVEAFDESKWLVGLVGEKQQHDAGITYSREVYDYTADGRLQSRDRDIQPRSGGALDVATTSWAYDSWGNVTSQTDTRDGEGNNRMVEFCYDGDGGGASWCPSLPGGTPATHSLRVGLRDAVGGVTELEYDWVTGAVLRVERFNESRDFRDAMAVVRDTFGRVEEQKFRGASFGGGDPDVQLAATAYHDAPIGLTPAYVEQFQYAEEGGGAPIRTARYLDGFGNLFRTVEETPSGYRGTAVFRDPVVRILRSIGPIDCDSDESCSNITETSEPSTEQEIDAVGRVIRTTLPDGEVTTDYLRFERFQPQGFGADFVFDAVEITDPNGNMTRRIMDGNRVVWVDECQDSGCASFDSTFYTYEATGEISTIYDALAISAPDYASPARYLRYHYDTLGRVIQTDEPNTGSSFAGYDHQGNVTSTTNVRGATTYSYYDALGRVSSIDRPVGVGEWDLDFAYDPISRKRQTVTTPNPEDPGNPYSDTWEYDDFGRVKRQIRSLYDTLVMDFEYDLLGRPTKIYYPSNNSSASYVYQGAYLEQVCRGVAFCESAPQNLLISDVQYDDLGRRTDTVTSTGTVHRDYYDMAPLAGRAVSRLKRLAITAGTAAGALDFNYQYDPMGNIIDIDDDSTTYDASATYTYDARNRLESWTDANSDTQWYTYDALGNLEGHGVASAGGTNQTFDPASEPHQITLNRIGEDYDYDADGNVIKRGTAHFVYDSANRLVCTGTDVGLCDGPGYRYDADGQLLWDGAAGQQLMGDLFKWKSTGSVGFSNIVAFGEVIAEVRKANAQLRAVWAPVGWSLPIPRDLLLQLLTGAGVLTWIALLAWLGVWRAFSEAPATAMLVLALTTLLVVPPPAWGGCRKDKGCGGGGGGTPPTVRTFFRDHLGSLAYRTGPNERQVYEPFGKAILTATGARDEFTGKKYHGATDMYYFGARWYDAEAGRFAGVDPLVTEAVNPQQMNAYGYALNDPVNLTDPTGMCVRPGIGGTGCGIGTAYGSRQAVGRGAAAATVIINDGGGGGAQSPTTQSSGTGSGGETGGSIGGTTTMSGPIVGSDGFHGYTITHTPGSLGGIRIAGGPAAAQAALRLQRTINRAMGAVVSEIRAVNEVGGLFYDRDRANKDMGSVVSPDGNGGYKFSDPSTDVPRGVEKLEGITFAGGVQSITSASALVIGLVHSDGSTLTSQRSRERFEGLSNRIGGGPVIVRAMGSSTVYKFSTNSAPLKVR